MDQNCSFCAEDNSVQTVTYESEEYGTGEKVVASILWLVVQIWGNGQIILLLSMINDNPYMTLLDKLQSHFYLSSML